MKHTAGFSYRAARLALGCAAAGLVSCATPFRPDRGDHPEGDLPSAFALYPAGERPPAPGWDAAAAPELSALIAAALEDNFSLLEARARLEQVTALARRAGSARYPAVDLAAGASRTERENATASMPGTSPSTVTENYYLGLAASYEVDLWGRVRASRESARLDAVSAREDLRAAEVTLSALVAEAWINLRTQREQVALLNRQLATNRMFLELIELRFRNGLANALDVLQQRQAVAAIEAGLPTAEAQTRLLLHELALLLGRLPSAAPPVGEGALPAPGPLPDTGIPSDLLAARPDVRAAGRRLASADWLVAAARADRLPAIRLTGRGEYNADELSAIFDNWLLNLAGSLTGPLIDGGRRRADVDRARAVADERLAAYRRTVTTAVKEVEDALVRDNRQQERMMRLERQLEAAQLAFEEARTRYLNGISDFLPVLAEQQTFQRLERDWLAARAGQWQYRIALHRALGGGGLTFARELQHAGNEATKEATP